MEEKKEFQIKEHWLNGLVKGLWFGGFSGYMLAKKEPHTIIIAAITIILIVIFRNAMEKRSRGQLKL